MIVDSSALVAVVLVESDVAQILLKMVNAQTLKISAVTLVETSMVLYSRGGQMKIGILDLLIAQLKARIIPVNQAQSLLAREAFVRYGKGRHPARLNLGDCFTYALAKQTGEHLLFKGNDFTKTDLLRA